jgi:Bacterial PH domain
VALNYTHVVRPRLWTDPVDGHTRVTDPDPDDARTAWAPPWPAVAVGLLAALGLAAWAVAAADPPGRLLVGLAALALAIVAGVGALARPRLRADETGLALRGATGTRHWPWERVDAVRVVRMRRLGLPAAYLEVEARDPDSDSDTDGSWEPARLLVLGRLELGTDPVDVAATLQHHRARAGRRAAARGPSAAERRDADGDEDDQDRGERPDGEEPGPPP